MDRVHVGATAQEMLSGTHFDSGSVFSWIESDLDHPLQKEIKRKIDWGKRTLSLCCHEAVAFKLRFLHSRNELFLPVLRAEIMRFLLPHNFSRYSIIPSPKTRHYSGIPTRKFLKLPLFPDSSNCVHAFQFGFLTFLFAFESNILYNILQHSKNYDGFGEEFRRQMCFPVELIAIWLTSFKITAKIRE